MIPYFKSFQKSSWSRHARVCLTWMEMPRAWKSSGCHGSARGHERHDKEPGARNAANGRKMRRKTIAKRVLYTGHEGCGEQAEANHVFCVCKHRAFVPGVSLIWFNYATVFQHETKRRRWRAMNAEEISSCDVDYVKFKTRVGCFLLLNRYYWYC